VLGRLAAGARAAVSSAVSLVASALALLVLAWLLPARYALALVSRALRAVL